MSYIDGNSIAHWSSDPSSPDAIEANQDSDPNAPTTMNQTDELKRENDALRDRLGKLCEACLRVSEGLDVSAVLREITENARALTNARYGVITVRDDAGRTPEVVSSGFTADEHQKLQDSPGRWKLDDYLRDVPAPLRLRDFAERMSELGVFGALPGNHDPHSPVVAAPLRHRGAHIGSFLLRGKETGSEFTKEDQEILVMFASQAATAIANARRHQDERRAQSDLEALVGTAQVGVVVFDAKTGDVMSVNGEARRIVGELRKGSSSLERLMDVLPIRRANEREISRAESPPAMAPGAASTVRAEEIVMETPDGRSVRASVNATPVRSENGEVDRFVVTMLDMTPVEELEGMRAEFLGMVSHELRAPLASIKGCTATMLGTSPYPDPVEMMQFFRIIDEQADSVRGLIADLLDAGRIEAGTLTVDPEPCSVADLVDQARNTFVATGGKHSLRIDLPPGLPLVRADRRRVVQVLEKLVSNAHRHSPEWAPIRVSAAWEGMYVAISVADEGVGVSADVLPHLFRRYFRTDRGQNGQGIRGPGLGLAICKGLVEAHGGRIRAESEGPGQGARFTFSLPVAEETPVPGEPDSAGSPALEGRRVLVADSDPHALRYVRHTLEEAGYSVTATGDPEEIPGLMATERPELVLLDLSLPGRNGIQLMEDIPAMRDVPVVFLSGYGQEESVASALEKGAADYVVKPFSPTELVARIKAALRGRAGRATAFELGELVIDYDDRRVTLAGQPMELTATEYDLLRELSVNAGRVMSYDLLLRRVWHRSGSRDSRRVRAFMKKIRQKLGDDATSPTYIFTVHRVGYRMAKPHAG